MKEKIQKLIPILISLVLFIAFGAALLAYARPMEDVTLDLSLSPEGENIAPADFDDKGWTVFTQQGDTVTVLEPDGFGGYIGAELGQTIYFSRLLDMQMDNPTLQLDGDYSESTFAVFLDGELLYTDFPELDNRIGFLQLPMSSILRQEPLKLTLPRNYQGKTLTIAQSTPEWAETPTARAYPARVLLYCGYANESVLIAETFAVFATAVVLFLIGAALLAAFLRRRKPLFLAAALVAMLWMCAVLSNASFYSDYFGYRTFDTVYVSLACSGALAMFLLTLRAPRFRRPLRAAIAAYCGSIAIYAGIMLLNPHSYATPLNIFLLGPLMEWIGVLILAAFLVLGLRWRKEIRFYRLFTPLTIAAAVIWWIWLSITGNAGLKTLLDNLASGQVTRLFYTLLHAFLATTLGISLWKALQDELKARMEQQLIREQKDLALASYNNLRHQHEEVMMLRHDMLRHFRTLHDMGGESKRTEYLAKLIEKNQKIRPIVDSGNEMLDIILNGRLGAAVDTGIRVEVPHVAAPGGLPLSDPDLCALVMNILDNAIAAASHAESPHLMLKIHEKDGHLGIVCENSFDPQRAELEAKKKPCRSTVWA